jgi:hypothetical protein
MSNAKSRPLHRPAEAVGNDMVSLMLAFQEVQPANINIPRFTAQNELPAASDTSSELPDQPDKYGC